MNPSDLPARSIALKDGSTATIRPVTPKDAAGVAEMLREIHAAGDGVMKHDDEAPLTTREMRRTLEQWIAGERSKHGSVFLIAVRDGRVLGNVNARRHDLRRLSHSARLGLGVRPDAQGLGVGRALMLALIEWARWTQASATGDDPGVLRLELSVIGDNHPAVALYEAIGFRHEGRRIGKVRDPDGTLRDDLDMALWI